MQILIVACFVFISWRHDGSDVPGRSWRQERRDVTACWARRMVARVTSRLACAFKMELRDVTTVHTRDVTPSSTTTTTITASAQRAQNLTLTLHENKNTILTLKKRRKEKTPLQRSSNQPQTYKSITYECYCHTNHEPAAATSPVQRSTAAATTNTVDITKSRIRIGQFNPTTTGNRASALCSPRQFIPQFRTATLARHKSHFGEFISTWLWPDC